MDKLNYQYNSLDQSAYSSVVLDNTVCAGYARCFQYLMQLVEVPTYNCHGWGGSERHAWNIIKLDDGFHNVDCTWDDSLAGYDYFNLSDAENKSHRRMEFSVYLPPCVSSDYKPASGQETIDAGSEANSAANNGNTNISIEVEDNGSTITIKAESSASAGN